jgi:hypothetical protein
MSVFSQRKAHYFKVDSNLGKNSASGESNIISIPGISPSQGLPESPPLIVCSFIQTDPLLVFLE